MHQFTTVLIVFALAIATPGGAQVGADTTERVRIRYRNGERIVGVLDSVSAEELRVRNKDGVGSRVILRSDITQVERSIGMHRNFAGNLRRTVGWSALGVGLWSALDWTPCRDTGFRACYFPNDRGEAFVQGAVAGAMLGVPVGIIIGAVVQSERWAPLTLPGDNARTFSVTPVLGSRVGLKATICFGGAS